MNFFFKRKLRKHLHTIDVPVRDQFLQSLRTSLVNEVAENHRPTFFTTMKTSFKYLAIIPLGLAAAMIFLQFNYNKPNNVFDVQAVLAESISNTFQTATSADFTHQRIAVQFANDSSNLDVETWRYQDNARVRLQPSQAGVNNPGFDYLISQVDNQSCTYSDISILSSNLSVAQQPNLQLECDEIIDVQMAPLVPGNLILNNIHIEDVPDTEKRDGVEWYLVWSTNTPLQLNVIFSQNNSGYNDAGSSADYILIKEPQPSVVMADGVYTYRAALYALTPRTPDPNNDDIHLGDYDTQLVQIQSGDSFSAVYQIHLREKTVQEFTAQQLSQAQSDYKQAVRTQVVRHQSPEEVYANFFSQAIDLKDDLSTLFQLNQNNEVYRGESAVRIRYKLSDSVKSESEFTDIDQVEYVINTQNKQVLEYTSFDSTNAVIQKISVEQNEIVTDTDPVTFFSVEGWKKNLGF